MSDKTVLTPDEIRELKCELARVNAQLFPSQAHIAMELAVTCIEQLERAVLAAATPGQVEASDPEAKGNISAWLRRRAGNDMVMIPGRLAGQIADHIDALKSASVSEQKGDV